EFRRVLFRSTPKTSPPNSGWPWSARTVAAAPAAPSSAVTTSRTCSRAPRATNAVPPTRAAPTKGGRSELPGVGGHAHLRDGDGAVGALRRTALGRPGGFPWHHLGTDRRRGGATGSHQVGRVQFDLVASRGTTSALIDAAGQFPDLD